MGLLDYGQLQRYHSAALLVSIYANITTGDVDSFHFRQHRNVVRALCYYRNIAEQGLPAIKLGLLLAHTGGLHDAYRKLRTLLHALPSLPALATHCCYLGS